MKTSDSKRGSNASSISSNSLMNTVAGGSDKQLVRRSSGKEKRLIRRSSSKSKKDKENGANTLSASGIASCSKKWDTNLGKVSLGSSLPAEPPMVSGSSPSRTKVLNRHSTPLGITEQDCTEVDVQTCHLSLSYKPRI